MQKRHKQMMQIEEVKDKSSEEVFLSVADHVYRKDANWVKPLIVEELATFDPEENAFFKRGKARRWVLKKEGTYIGRIAAFVSNLNTSEPIGGVGFFECIEDEEAAFLLFDTAKNWLASLGVKAMDGPINLGENDNNWGLLVQGFTMPAYGMSYNPPYYQDFFERYGFEKRYEQYTNHFNILKGLPDRFRRIAKRVKNNPNLSFRHFKKAKTVSFLRDLEKVYNKAWEKHEDFQPIDYDYLLASFKKMKSFLKEELIWFAYAEGKPIGFIVSVPDINQIIQTLNGKLNFWNKMKFFYYAKTKKINRLRVLVMGIVPEYQNRGIESGLIDNSFEAAKNLKQYQEAELSWVGSFNDKMMALHKASGAKLGKVHITYRYQF